MPTPSERLAQQGLDYQSLDLSHPMSIPDPVGIDMLSPDRTGMWTVHAVCAIHYTAEAAIGFLADENVLAPDGDRRWGVAFASALERLGWRPKAGGTVDDVVESIANEVVDSINKGPTEHLEP